MTASALSAIGGVAAVNEEGIARRFWIKFRKETVFALYSPFVVCIAAGNLEVETFLHYLDQGVYFLKAFAQAYELAEDCSDDDDAKSAISDLRKAVMESLKLQESAIREWGFEPLKEGMINSMTAKYTEFLLATASGKVDEGKGPGKIATPFEKTKVAAYTFGAIAPFLRLHAFLGRELKALLDPSESSHRYGKWIDYCSSGSFEVSALQIEDLLDKLSISLTGEELDVIEKLYHQAIKHEIDFFFAQPMVQQTIVPLFGENYNSEQHLIIFCDFDLTCTVVDSSAILAQIAIITAPKGDQTISENQLSRKSSSDLKNEWGDISRQYTEGYEQCIESIMPSEKVAEFNYEDLRKALEQLSNFEKGANSKVIESGVLRGLNLEDIKKAGEHLVLQDGCTGFFQKIVKDKNLNADIHVLSYCWCGDLIRSAFSSGGLDVVNVHANELMYNESISTGDIINKVESPIDKVQAFNDILNTGDSTGKQLTVYIGDSVADLLGMLEADIGIVMGSSSSLRRIATQFGVSLVPLFSGLVEKQKKFAQGNSSNWNRLSGTLYTVSSWAEVHAFILGQQTQ